MKVDVKNSEKLSVLIVDDDIDIRETMISFLELMDVFTFVIHAIDGSDAFIKYQKQKFDLIITDLNMPKVGGLELIKKVKNFELKNQFGKTPFLVLSGNVTGDEVKKAVSYGVKYIITKPCHGREFTGKVQEILEKESSAKLS